MMSFCSVANSTWFWPPNLKISTLEELNNFEGFLTFKIFFWRLICMKIGLFCIEIVNFWLQIGRTEISLLQTDPSWLVLVRSAVLCLNYKASLFVSAQLTLSLSADSYFSLLLALGGARLKLLLLCTCQS